jgi:hypothetical protein
VLTTARTDGLFVPRISDFYGVAIYMYYRDHEPPHFHAIYGEHEAVITIERTRVLDGGLPRRALALVRQWARLHEEELGRNWTLAREGRRLRSIGPLD